MATALTPQQKEHTRATASSPWPDALACALAVLALFLLARPYVDIGMSDDFSYVKTAWVFAQTGHFVYNGWATAMLGWQILWAAPFIKLLGPTWFACRLSVTVLLVLTVFATHAVARRSGLNRAYAAFATLVIGASPLTLALSATFMTDTGGLLVILLALLCAMRALRAHTDSAVLSWLALGFAIGAVGGTSRQIAWMCSLVMMPSAAWLLRRRKGVLAVTVVGWLVSFAVMIACLRWFNHQPFSVPEPIIQGGVNFHTLRTLADKNTELVMCTVLLLVPVWAVALRAAFRQGARTLLLGLAGGLLVLAVAWAFLHNNLTNGWMPWTGDWLARLDLLRVQDMWSYGAWPATFSKAGRAALSLPIAILFALFLAAIFRAPKSTFHPASETSFPDHHTAPTAPAFEGHHPEATGRSHTARAIPFERRHPEELGSQHLPPFERRHPDPERSEGEGSPYSARPATSAEASPDTLRWTELLILLVPFTLSYLALLLPREIWSILLDRYLLPLFALAAFPLLRLAQERLTRRIDAAAWAVFALVSFWGVAGLHDWVAGFRARTTAVARLQSAGIPVDKIRAGFELDGLTQIDKTGAVVDPRVHFPPGFDTHPHRPAGLPPQCEHLYHPYTPTLEPEYWLTYDQLPCLAPTPFGEVDYRAWLPPFHRHQLILKLSYEPPSQPTGNSQPPDN